MPRRDWNEAYATGELPWDVGEPDEHLVRLIRAGAVAKGRALEVGCGTGTNSVWLAGQGFDVLGVDLSPLAVEKAKAKREGAAGACRFQVLDFLAAEPPGGRFHFVFDRGCFHTFHEPAERARFAARVAELLAPEGMWLSLIGSTEGPPRDMGPPRRSAREIADALEPVLELRELRGIQFHTLLPEAANAWFCLSRKRTIPAQPSTSP